ncbi:hypothetical protein [Bacteroides bouchesdurhonensis]
MKSLNEKLTNLKKKLDNGDKITIAIFGLGSVGCYLLDYLVSLADPQLRLVVVGRNKEKMQMDVNIIRTASTIRKQCLSEIIVEGGCDFENPDTMVPVFTKYQPDFIVNSSRLFAGLKYGTISWHNLRAYGIWSPLSVQLSKHIMEAYAKADAHAISINTSYPDAVIPWLKTAGMAYFDFGSGNLNHLIPRMKFYVAEKFGINNYNDIDISLVASHFHDVVISKEGQTDGVDLPLVVKYQGKVIDINKEELFKNCSIAMPTDQKRNMMNASSNFDIINSIIKALRNSSKEKFHTPGVDGNIGGFPFIIDGTGSEPIGYIDPQFNIEDAKKVDRTSIYLDGIENVENGNLYYTDELIAKVKSVFNVEIPKTVNLKDAEKVAELLIEKIIKPNVE